MDELQNVDFDLVATVHDPPAEEFNALSLEQKSELESLQSAFVNHPIVQDYFKTQTDFATLCQTLGDALSESIGLNYAAACGASCCG